MHDARQIIFGSLYSQPTVTSSEFTIQGPSFENEPRRLLHALVKPGGFIY
jgi:hypothetical protein